MGRRRRRTRQQYQLLGWIVTLGIAFSAVWIVVLFVTAWFLSLEARSGHPLLVQIGAWIWLAAVVLLGGAAWQAWRRRKRTRARHVMELLALTPSQFEEAIGRVLTDLGYRSVRHVGGAGDLSADLTAIGAHGGSVVVQCKRLAPGSHVNSPDVQKFIGMLTVHHRADRGIFVTTAAFTGPARALATEHAIELIDGERLGALLTEIHESRQPRGDHALARVQNFVRKCLG